jgi:hypothetical protein
MAAVPVLDILFCTKARTVLLRRLARESLPLSARRLAELSSLTHRAVITALEPLVEEGIVTKRTAGPAYQYSLQREHAAVETVLLPVLAAEDLLPGLMARELVALFSPAALSITLFGSAARGEDVPGSDVDVLVVTSSAGECETIVSSAGSGGRSPCTVSRSRISARIGLRSSRRRPVKEYCCSAQTWRRFAQTMGNRRTRRSRRRKLPQIPHR